jgi:hypothetical protein
MRGLRNALLIALPVALACRLFPVSAQQPVGWRGDGTGKYPSAEPPVTWSRMSTAVEGLRFLDHKPSGDPPPAGTPPGTPMPDGVIRQWLVLGLVPFPQDARLEKETLPGETELAPDEGQATAGLTWKKATLPTAYLDFARLVGKPADAVAYACAYVYAPAAGTFRMNLTFVGGVRVLLNGKSSPNMGGARSRLDLVKGWNRILLKVSPGSKAATGVADWYAVPVLHGWAPCEYRQTNIAWRTPLPGLAGYPGAGGQGVGAPVIAGDRIFLLSEPHDLIALRKSDGKVLWLRRNSALEAADATDRLHPAYKEAQAVAAKLDAMNTTFLSGAPLDVQFHEAKAQLERDLQKAMKRVDAEKFTPGTPPDVGFSGFTPGTDGQFLYAWFGNGITACYDLDGNRRWIRVDRRAPVEHGFSSSPLLIDGKLVVFMRDLMAFDAQTGKLAWQIPLVEADGLNPQGFFHGSPVAARIGPVPVIVLGNGAIVRAADGKSLRTDKETGNQAVASPVVEAGTIFRLPVLNSELILETLPERLANPLALARRRIPLDLSGYPKHYLPWYLSSPVIHQGLAYLVNNAGVLTVVDVHAGQVVYQRLLDLDPLQAHNEAAARGIGASLALAGGRLYLLGNNGTALVLAPGRAYRQLAKNKIESVVMPGHWGERQERFMANPVCDGRRLYLRGEGHLYALGP